MRRRIVLGLILVFALSAAGCGGSRERGKNSDADRPIPQKK